MRSTLAFGVCALAGLASAQSSVQYNYPYTIDPNSVSKTDRQAWCQNQKAQCPLICLQQPGITSMTTISNDCDPDLLTYTCVCENNVAPNITQFSQTLPYYICTAWGTQCVAACSDNTCADKCRADHPCGAQHPVLANTSTATMHTATQTAASTSVAATGFGGPAASSTAKKGMASTMMNVGQSYGLAVVFTGVFAGFAILL